MDLEGWYGQGLGVCATQVSSECFVLPSALFHPASSGADPAGKWYEWVYGRLSVAEGN